MYAPDGTTDATGTVTVDVPLPDSLTRYRVMAVAIDGAEQFGKGESTITARLPVMVRPSAPRFLNFGDRFELPVVVQNQTDTALDVDVVVQGSNLVFADADDSGAAGKRVTVPANDRVEVRFPASADQVGHGAVPSRRRRCTTMSDRDAAVVELPVYTPATTEAFATYGVIDDTRAARSASRSWRPAGVFPQFGGLEIGTSSTALQALTDAVLYLEDYPYETADGYASRIMAIASLRDVLDAFDADGLPDPAALNARMDADIAALAALQNDDGGWSWWARGLESSPWQSIQSTHALVLAQQAGYAVPDATLAAALAFLADIEAHIPSDCSHEVRVALSAYAIHVRALAGDRDVAKATGIYEDEGDNLQLDSMAWLWPSIDDESIRAEIERRFENAATETANAATFATSYGEDDYLIANSDRRTDGVILDALIGETTRQRSDRQGRQRAARSTDPRPVEQRPGQRLHPDRHEPLLPHLRVGDARLGRAGVARRHLRRRARVPGTHDGPRQHPRSDGPADAGLRHRGPARGIGPPVLPARAALRAGRPPAGRARRGIRRRPRVRGRRRSGRRHP